MKTRIMLLLVTSCVGIACAGNTGTQTAAEAEDLEKGPILHFVIGPWQAFTIISVKCSELEDAFRVRRVDVEATDANVRDFLNVVDSLSKWEDSPSYLDTRIRMSISYPDSDDVEVCFGRTGVEYEGNLYLINDRVLEEIEKYVPHFSE